MAAMYAGFLVEQELAQHVREDKDGLSDLSF